MLLYWKAFHCVLRKFGRTNLKEELLVSCQAVSLRLAGAARAKQWLCRPSATHRATTSASTAALQVSRNVWLFSWMFAPVDICALHPNAVTAHPPPLSKIQPGPVSTWALSYASSVRGSTETWAPTCPAFAPWTSTTFRGSSRWFSAPLATTR